MLIVHVQQTGATAAISSTTTIVSNPTSRSNARMTFKLRSRRRHCWLHRTSPRPNSGLASGSWENGATRRRGARRCLIAPIRQELTKGLGRQAQSANAKSSSSRHGPASASRTRLKIPFCGNPSSTLRTAASCLRRQPFWRSCGNGAYNRTNPNHLPDSGRDATHRLRPPQRAALTLDSGWSSPSLASPLFAGPLTTSPSA
jgi:hypothetical protein